MLEPCSGKMFGWERRNLLSSFLEFSILLFTKEVTVKFVKDSGWGCFSFRRYLHGEYLEKMEELKILVDEVELSDIKDRVILLLSKIQICGERALPVS